MAAGYAGAGLGGYSVGNAGGTGRPSRAVGGKNIPEMSLDRLKRQYTDYLTTKREEIDEQQDARRFRHGSQWTAMPVTTSRRLRLQRDCAEVLKWELYMAPLEPKVTATKP